MLRGKAKAPAPPETTSNAPVTVAALEAVFEGCYDFESRDVHIGGDIRRKARLCFIDGLVSGSDVAQQVIRPLTDPERFGAVTK